MDLLGIPKSVEIHRISKTSLQPSWRYFPRIMEDEFCHIFSMYSLARKKLDRDPPSVVIASGPPFTAFIAAYFLARRFGAKLVLDYRDEWSERPFAYSPRGNSDLLWERRCLQAADAIFFATQSYQDHYLDTFSYLPASKCHILHNGWEPAEFAVQEVPDEAPSDHGHRLVLSYVGVYGKYALSGNFFTVLAEVLERNSGLRDRFQVRLVGQKVPEAIEQFARFEKKLPGTLELIEHVPKREAIRMMCESRALLLLNVPTFERMHTGKIFDYLASGRPLLVYGDTGEIGRLVGELGAGAMVPINDPDALERALLKLQSTPASEWHTPAREAFLREHTREALARKLFEILERL